MGARAHVRHVDRQEAVRVGADHVPPRFPASRRSRRRISGAVGHVVAAMTDYGRGVSESFPVAPARGRFRPLLRRLVRYLYPRQTLKNGGGICPVTPDLRIDENFVLYSSVIRNEDPREKSFGVFSVCTT